MENLKSEINEAELNFVRKLGQLKYLNHLRKNKEVEDCPICNTRPETKVSACFVHVFVCVCVCVYRQLFIQSSKSKIQLA